MSGADLRVLLGMAFGCLWGIGVSQWVRAAVEGGPVFIWAVFTFAGAAGVAATARYARHGGLRRNQ